MKFALSLAAAASLALGGMVMAQDAAPTNAIANPSFEQEAGSNPRGWHVRAAAPEYIRNGTEGQDTHTGTHAVKLSNPVDFHQRWAINNDQMVQVKGGQKIRYSAWVKVSGMDGRQFVQLRIEQFGADGKILPPGAGSSSVNGEKHRPQQDTWVQVSDELTTHPDARSIRPLLVLASGNPESTAVAIFDDVELVVSE